MMAQRSTKLSLVTSLGAARQLEPAHCVELEDKYVTVAPAETYQFCDLAGPGRIVRIWFTTPTLGRGDVLREVICRMYWDDETAPSVECPLGDLFGAAFGRPHLLISDRIVIAGGGYLCRFEMPFNSRAIVEIENQSSAPLRHFFYQIGFYRDPQPNAELETFHAHWRRSNPTEAGRAHQVLDAVGKGRFAGLKLDMQNRSWWLKPPLRSIAIPRGFGLGLLEGWESIRVDGEEQPAMVGTGGEDYFNGGFYFTGGAFHTPTHGATVRSYLTGRAAAYRFHVDDPIGFERSIAISIDHGFRNQMQGDCCSVAYWYQREPHAPFPPLPPASERRPLSPWRNVLQHALLALLVAAALALVWALGAGMMLSLV